MMKSRKNSKSWEVSEWLNFLNKVILILKMNFLTGFEDLRKFDNES